MKNSAVFIESEGELLRLLGEGLKAVFSPGDKVAVKLHMGEPGNRYYIKSGFTKKIVGVLKELGCDPFVFDTPVVYRSPRGSVEGYIKSAAAHGYSPEELGVPVIISDRSLRAEGRYMEYGLAAEPLEADGVLLLTHFKGHIACGMGGAIKNIGMGCMSKETKGKIHAGGEPVYVSGCTECGTCVENCPTDNIEIVGGEPRFGRTWCPGCSNCVLSCPEEAIAPKKETFDRLIADAACCAHERFKKFYALNALVGITKLCDCIAASGPVIIDDIGFVGAADMLSADIASLRLAEERSGEEDIFRKHNKTSPWGHVRAAAEIMGRDLEVGIERLK
jgi:uncharacterized Fe-S center protein